LSFFPLLIVVFLVRFFRVAFRQHAGLIDFVRVLWRRFSRFTRFVESNRRVFGE
jgi:hypothetical protein